MQLLLHILLTAGKSVALESYLDNGMKGMKQTFGGGGAGSGLSIIELIVMAVLISVLANLIIMFWMKADMLIRSGKHMRPDQYVELTLFGFLILPFYLEKRPKGKITLCFHCGKPKLKHAHLCQFCGQEDALITKDVNHYGMV